MQLDQKWQQSVSFLLVSSCGAKQEKEQIKGGSDSVNFHARHADTLSISRETFLAIVGALIIAMQWPYVDI